MHRVQARTSSIAARRVPRLQITGFIRFRGRHSPISPPWISRRAIIDPRESLDDGEEEGVPFTFIIGNLLTRQIVNASFSIPNHFGTGIVESRHPSPPHPSSSPHLCAP